MYEPVNEDAEIAQMVRARDFYRLDALIERQNAKIPIWGFMMPDLHQFLQHDELSRFRNPHLVVIFRDPIAVAVRNATSEHMDGMYAVIEAASTVSAHTVRALFLSYEKAIVFAQVFVDNMLNYCGIALHEGAST